MDEIKTIIDKVNAMIYHGMIDCYDFWDAIESDNFDVYFINADGYDEVYYIYPITTLLFVDKKTKVEQQYRLDKECDKFVY